MPMTFAEVSDYMLSLPGVVAATHYGTPSFRARTKFLTRLKEDGESLAIHLGFDEREMLLEADPDSFYLTDHYRNYPMVLVRLAKVEAGTLKRLLLQYWLQVALKRDVAAYQAGVSA